MLDVVCMKSTLPKKPHNEAIRLELLSMKESDLRMRDDLASKGTLFGDYDAGMEEVHRRNAARLREIVSEFGWPGQTLVGQDGCEAAWMIAQHAVSEPSFMQEMLQLLQFASKRNEAPYRQVAYLQDRILMMQGRPQIYGTQYDWDEQGEFNPWPIQDPQTVDASRKEAGLDNLTQNTRRMRESVRQSLEKAPGDPVLRRKQFENWAQKTGWRNNAVNPVILRLTVLPGLYSVCRLSPEERIPEQITQLPFYICSRTPDELTVVCDEASAPQTGKRETGWRLFKFEGPFPFHLTGILSSVAVPLAQAGVGIFAASTFDTDYVLVKHDQLTSAVSALISAGHHVEL